MKHEPEFGMEYATEVSKFVAQGACRDFRRAHENWRNPELRAAVPSFRKKNLQGTGSFLAASGVDRVKYDGLPPYRAALSGLGETQPRAAGGHRV